jgi:hypothetical protein
VDLATAQAQAKGVAPAISREGGQRPTFARASQNVAVAAMLLYTLHAPFVDEVEKLYYRLGENLAIVATQQAKCSLQCQARDLAPSPGCSRTGWQKTTIDPFTAGMASSPAWVSSQGPPWQ